MCLSSKQILALQSLKGFGKVTINKILDHSVETSFVGDDQALYLFLQDYLIKNKVRVTCPNYLEFEHAIDCAKKIVDISYAKGVSIISRFDPQYPKQLQVTIDETGKLDIPVLIHCKGNIDALKVPGIAIIGTRQPTIAGSKAAEFFGYEFAKVGFNVVSGLALGCDSFAHHGALNVGGITTAVLAGGLDHIYPRENHDLADMILNNNGLLLSENPIGTQTNKYNLVARDRIQSALSLATLVVQTGIKGGTMHAAKATLISNKRLWVVDYKNPDEFNCDGNKYLLTQGAKPISSKNFEFEYKSIIA